MARGYEMLYDNLKTQLQNCDLEAHAFRMGLSPPINGVIHCGFLGRTYLISRKGVDQTDDRPDNINSRSLLIHYLLSNGGGGEPSLEFVPLSKLSGMIPGQNLGDDFFAQSLRQALGQDYCGPLSGAERLGGVLEESSKVGEHHWYFQVLPKIALKLIHYEPDDEFPLGFKYLFDKNALKILEFECLAFLTGCFNYELAAVIKQAGQ